MPAARGVDCIAADLPDRAAPGRLPKLANVACMAGRKFGSSGNEELTWAMKVWTPVLNKPTHYATRDGEY